VQMPTIDVVNRDGTPNEYMCLVLELTCMRQEQEVQCKCPL